MQQKKRAIVSLQVIFAVSVGLLLSALTLTTGRIIIDKERSVLEEETRRRLLAQCRSLASLSASPMLDEFPEFVLHPLIKGILAENDELAYAVVVDGNGKIRGDRYLRKVDLPFEDRLSLSALAVEKHGEGGEGFRQDAEILEVSVPVVYHDGSRLGQVYLGMRKAYIHQAIAAARLSTLRVVLGALVLGLVLTVFLVSRIIRPINQLTKGTEEIGRGNLDYRIEVKSRTEIGRLADTINEMARRLKTARKELIENERFERELEIAREIEEKLLPRPNLELPGYEVAGFHESAQTVGGDYYDLIPIDEEHVGVTVADVAGKGVPGLVVMAMTSALLRTHAPHHPSPAKTLIRLNDMLTPTMRRGMFITMFYGVLHLPTGRFTFAGAGHNPLILFRRGSDALETHVTGGIPLGLFPDRRFADRIQDQTVRLEQGDGILQYTDGVNEAANGEMEEFGVEGLREAALRRKGASAREMVAGIVDEVRRFADGAPQSDDITVFALKRTLPVHTPVRTGAATARSSA